MDEILTADQKLDALLGDIRYYCKKCGVTAEELRKIVDAGLVAASVLNDSIRPKLPSGS